MVGAGIQERGWLLGVTLVTVWVCRKGKSRSLIVRENDGGRAVGLNSSCRVWQPHWPKKNCFLKMKGRVRGKIYTVAG